MDFNTWLFLQIVLRGKSFRCKSSLTLTLILTLALTLTLTLTLTPTPTPTLTLTLTLPLTLTLSPNMKPFANQTSLSLSKFQTNKHISCAKKKKCLILLISTISKAINKKTILFSNNQFIFSLTLSIYYNPSTYMLR